MFKTENAHLVPNLLAKAVDEDQVDVRVKVPLLKDATNTKKRACHFSKVSKCRGDEQSLANLGGQNQSLDLRRKDQNQKENYSTHSSKLKNLLINFDSQEESIPDDQKSPNQPTQTENAESNLHQLPQQAAQEEDLPKEDSKSKKESGLLLIMNSEDEEEDEDQVQTQQAGTKKQLPHLQLLQIPEQTGQKSLERQKQAQNEKNSSKKQFLLKLQFEEDDQESSQKIQQVDSISQKETPTAKRMIIRLAGLISRFGSNYYQEPIPFGAVFQCIVKRERCASQTKYHLYDCFSLKNFMSVIKDEQGYLIVSKELVQTTTGDLEQNVNVVGRVVSNFFGTEFNCCLHRYPYLRGYKYPVKQANQKVITIEYQTNIFGLKGPRKISAYIPIEGERKHQNLNEIYEKQAKKKLTPTILKFKNKTPKWSREVNAYVLNFGGRASVSSIKNFIMVGQNQADSQHAIQPVLFGKYGRELFNLDVRHPFSIIQALSLALSSFDRKLACQ